MCMALLALAANAEYSDHRNRQIDSLEQVLRRPDLSWNDCVSAHGNLMWGYLQTSGEQSIMHCNKVLHLTEGKNKGLTTRADAFRLLGQHAYAKCIYDSAQIYFDKALETISMMGNNGDYSQSDIDNLLSATYGAIGNMYNIQSMTTLAIEYYLKALELFQKNGWKESEAILYYNVGEMFLEMGNNDEAERYYNLSLNVATSAGDSLIMAMPRSGLAMVMLSTNRLPEAMNEAELSLDYYKKHSDEEFEGLGNGYVLIARIFHNGYGDIQQAQNYLDKALEIIGNNNFGITDIADAYSFQAELCLARNEWNESIDWCRRSLEKNDDDLHHNIIVYKMLAEAYTHIGDAKNAELYVEKLHASMTEMSNARHQSAISEMQVRYDTHQKELMIERMEMRHKTIMVIIVLSAIALVLISLFLWRIIQQRKQIVEVKSKLIGERDERQRLSHDIHDRLGGMLTATKLKIEANENDEALSLLRQTTEEMRRIAHHLLPDSLTRNGLCMAVSDYCNVLPNVHYTCLGEYHRHDEHIEVLCYIVLHEIINNALKHANARHIWVQLLFDENNICATVSDDGVGFDTDATYSGCGLSSIRERIELAGGKIFISSQRGKGTEIMFTINA